MREKRAPELGHLMAVDDAKRLAMRRGASAQRIVSRLVFSKARKEIGSTLIDGRGDDATVSRHAVDRILAWGSV